MFKLLGWASIAVTIGALAALPLTGANAQATGAQVKKVPDSLVDVGELGENVYDLSKAGDWAKVTEKLSGLKDAAKRLAGDLKDGKAEKKQLDEIIASLAKTTQAKDKLATMRDANQVTRIAADLSEPFNPQVPAAVTRLDFFGRELEIGTAAKDKDQLKAAVMGLRKNWDKVRPAVKTNGGEAEAKRFDALLTKLEAVTTVDDYGKLAAPILDEVDNLEKVFKK
jgi:hypothetical protein